jgi:hypothetical protein
MHPVVCRIMNGIGLGANGAREKPCHARKRKWRLRKTLHSLTIAPNVALARGAILRSLQELAWPLPRLNGLESGFLPSPASFILAFAGES